MFRITPAIATAALTAMTTLCAFPARAEVEFSVYGGYQTAPHSTLTIRGDDVLPDQDVHAGWDGDSFAMPPYYGIRGTWWQSDTLGFGLELNHAKVYADDVTLAATGFERLEMSDGINILTANAFRRFPGAFGSLTPYVGAGVGISVPHIELFDEGTRTFEYQFGGPAVALMAGASYAIDETWSVFGEYKITYSQNELELDTGGTLETDIVTNALNFGVSYTF